LGEESTRIEFLGWIEVGAVERGAEAKGSGTREDSEEEEEHFKSFLENLRIKILNLQIESYEGCKEGDSDRLLEHDD
jgi:hypothetical protein